MCELYRSVMKRAREINGFKYTENSEYANVSDDDWKEKRETEDEERHSYRKEDQAGHGRDKARRMNRSSASKDVCIYIRRIFSSVAARRFRINEFRFFSNLDIVLCTNICIVGTTDKRKGNS